ncbi:Chorismate mutase [Mycena chlorophos]|uniref:Chorismate mutase n=1 Tax=Mycena chlorophos TaxID=658473 RepID=A0A8H6RX45_MYCCL|nr:Chorismate mutase [Mycena chlorophos]
MDSQVLNHCKGSYCADHFRVAAHNCPKFDAAKYDRVSPNCPLCNSVVSVRAGQDPNEAVETHFLVDCSVLTGRVKSKAPVCARPRCGKTLFAPISCTKCQKQFCPAHRFPADHICMPATTARTGGLTAGSKLLELNTKATAAGAKTVGAIKAAASAAQASASSRAAAASSRATAAPSTSAASSSKPAIPIPAVFSKTDRSLSTPSSPKQPEPQLEIISAPEPLNPGLIALTMQSQNFMTGDPLSLDRIRGVLTRLEDTIIFSLIERAQFAQNPRIYQRGAFPELKASGFEGSWLEWFLKEIETFHAKARRYTSPDEYPFTPPTALPSPVLPPLAFPDILYPNTVNANASIQSFYVRTIVPRITRRATAVLAASKRAKGITGDDEYEDDGNYGSAATIDVEALQAISKRVHYGKFVSESKFQDNPGAFIPHILTPNREALEALITKPEVERKLLVRLRKKAETYAQDFGPDGDYKRDAEGNVEAIKIDVDGVVDLYESFIIPLTKEIEVDYLLQRLRGLSNEEIDTLKQKTVAT